MISFLQCIIFEPISYSEFILQGPSTQIDAFQTNIFSWLDDIMIKKKIFLKSRDREIWYKHSICICLYSRDHNLYISEKSSELSF